MRQQHRRLGASAAWWYFRMKRKRAAAENATLREGSLEALLEKKGCIQVYTGRLFRMIQTDTALPDVRRDRGNFYATDIDAVLTFYHDSSGRERNVLLQPHVQRMRSLKLGEVLEWDGDTFVVRAEFEAFAQTPFMRDIVAIAGDMQANRTPQKTGELDYAVHALTDLPDFLSPDGDTGARDVREHFVVDHTILNFKTDPDSLVEVAADSHTATDPSWRVHDIKNTLGKICLKIRNTSDLKYKR